MTDGLFGRRGRRALLALCAVGLLVILGVAIAQTRPGAPGVPLGQVRLGPDSGEPVADYLARLPATLPPPGQRTLALVQLDLEVTTAAAAALAGSAPLGQVVFRLPIPRVQTALRFETVPAGAPLGPALDTARLRAEHAAEADAARLTGRPGAVAAAEAAAYGTPCACVLAFVVQADREGLAALAATPGVRAVEAAPVGATAPELALAPLLPEQVTAATPPPDDGPVP